MKRLVAALGLAVLGGAGALLASGRDWQTVTVPRVRPFADAVVDASGHTLVPALPALGIVALAAVVAVLATRGLARRIVGGLIVATGVALGWQAVAGLRAVSAGRARSLAADAHSGVGLDVSRAPRVDVHATWPVLVLVCALAVLAAGLAVAVWGPRWAALGRRYDAPRARTEFEEQRGMWNALDRGDDPTARTQR